ncbi:MAG: glycosyltransferase family 4 protein [Phycisphaeraceae bacterium]
MKILFLAPQPFFTNRGTPIAVRAALQALSEQGHEIDVVSYHEGEDVHIASVTHHRCTRPPGVRRVPIGPSWQKLLCDVALMFKAVSMARRTPYDVVHAVEESAFIARLIKTLFGVPYIFDMDSLMSRQIIEKNRLFAPIAWFFAWMERGAIRRSDGVLAVCPALVEEAKRHHPSGHIVLLPDIPFTGMQHAELPKALTDATGIRLMYVGNLESYQGIDLMLEAFAQVAETYPDATLLIVGGSEEHIEQYRTKAGPLAQTGRIVFVGPVPIDCLGHVLKHADILVSPRVKGNNTPMKVYSYLQSGKPVIATRLNTHTQVMTDEVAVLVDPDPHAMAAGMRRLIESGELRNRIGSSGRAYVEAEFSEQRFRERLEAFYKSLASTGRHKIQRPTQTPAA